MKMNALEWLKQNPSQLTSCDFTKKDKKIGMVHSPYSSDPDSLTPIYRGRTYGFDSSTSKFFVYKWEQQADDDIRYYTYGRKEISYEEFLKGISKIYVYC